MNSLSTASSFAQVVGWVIGIINTIIPVLTLLALVLFLYSGFRYAFKGGDSHGKSAEREALLWGLVALFVLVSVWGILRITCNTLVGSSDCGAGSAAESVSGAPMNIIPPTVR